MRQTSCIFYLIIILISLTNTVKADTVKIGAILYLKPYMFENDSGIEADIVREAFAFEDYQVAFYYEPNARTRHSYNRNIFDGVLTVNELYPDMEGSFFSDPYITYQNIIVSLDKRNLTIEKISDLQNVGLIAFQQASIILGKEFKNIVKNNEFYSEIPNQESQIKMLYMGRTDSILIEKNIFKYYRNHLKGIPIDIKIRNHYLFPLIHYQVAFHKKELRDAFNRGLKKLKENGRYKAIIQSYIINFDK